VQEIYYQQTLKTLRYKQVSIPTFERAVEYCFRAQTETELFQKKYQ
ncbi:16502_t:CDS:1, partial [Funneliformis mosseae]